MAKRNPGTACCLSFAREKFGDEHPSVATSFNNLARLYQAQGRYSEAEPLYQQALALYAKIAWRRTSQCGHQFE
jgi:tetratricopeptide (TPR) repeat protein